MEIRGDKVTPCFQEQQSNQQQLSWVFSCDCQTNLIPDEIVMTISFALNQHFSTLTYCASSSVPPYCFALKLFSPSSVIIFCCLNPVQKP